MCPRATVPSARCVVAAVTASLCSALTAGAAALELSRSDAAAVERARSGATTRLQGSECQKLLTDFSDLRGHSLQEKLEASGLSASDYLQTIVFVDGSAARSCKRSGVLLVASPGLATVAVCPAEGRPMSRLAQAGFRNHWLAESILIHEMLHTLGLGENPPTTEQITWRVQQRCHP